MVIMVIMIFMAIMVFRVIKVITIPIRQSDISKVSICTLSQLVRK